MPSFTKKAIVASFLQLIGKKPFDKITVRDIVDDCGINRNTFYYYFQDIYAVLEEICQVAIDSVPEGESLSNTLCTFYQTMARFAGKYTRAARGLALSFGFEGMERYFGGALDAMIGGCLLRDGSAARLGPEETELFVVLLRHAMLGFCLALLRGDKGSSHEATVKALDGVLRRLGENSDKT